MKFLAALLALLTASPALAQSDLNPNGYPLSSLTGNEVVDCQLVTSPYITTCTTQQIANLAAVTAVQGPSSSVIGHAVVFNNATGNLVADAGAAPVLNGGPLGTPSSATFALGSITIFGGTNGDILGIGSGGNAGKLIDAGVVASTLTGGPFLPLAGGALTGAVTSTNTLALDPASSLSVSSGQQAFAETITTANLLGALNVQQTGTGTATGLSAPFDFNNIKISSDNINAGSGFVTGFNLSQYFGGSAMYGGRVGIISNIYFTAPSNASNTNRNYVALAGNMVMQAGDNGSSTTIGSGAQGGAFGGGFDVVICGTSTSTDNRCTLGAATNLLGAVAQENDVTVYTGGSAAARMAYNAVDVSSQVQGATYDVAYHVGSSENVSLGIAPVGWLCGFCASSYNNAFPFSSGATFAGLLSSGTITNGIDLHLATISGYAWQSPGATISGAGNLIALGLKTGGYITSVNNLAGSWPPFKPGSIVTCGVIADNFTNAGAEVDFINCGNSGGFNFYQMSGTGAGSLVASIGGSGGILTQGLTATAVAPTVSANQIGYGSTVAAATSCGSLSGAAGCIVVNIAGTPHYVPYY